MRKMLCATALVTAALLGAGCKKGPDVVGKWTATSAGGSVDMEFKPDNTFTMGMKGGMMSMTATGDYKVDGEKLSLTVKDVKAPGLTPALTDMIKKSPNFGKPQDMKLAFTGSDEVSLTPATPAGGAATAKAPGGLAGQALNLKRVK